MNICDVHRAVFGTSQHPVTVNSMVSEILRERWSRRNSVAAHTGQRGSEKAPRERKEKPGKGAHVGAQACLGVPVPPHLPGPRARGT